MQYKKVSILLLSFLSFLFFSCINQRNDNGESAQEQQNSKIKLVEYYSDRVKQLQDTISYLRKSNSDFEIYQKSFSEYFSYRYEVLSALGEMFSKNGIELEQIGKLPSFQIIDTIALETQSYYYYSQKCRFDTIPDKEFYQKIEILCNQSKLNPLDYMDVEFDFLLSPSAPSGWYKDYKNRPQFSCLVHLTETQVVTQVIFQKDSLEFECYTHDWH